MKDSRFKEIMEGIGMPNSQSLFCALQQVANEVEQEVRGETNRTDSQKLLMLSDACSDVLYGGESGWENVPFEQFVSECRKSIAFGVKARVSILQYNSLRKHFHKMVDDILGSDYYNMGIDVYECDRLCCEDMTRKSKSFFKL